MSQAASRCGYHNVSLGFFVCSFWQSHYLLYQFSPLFSLTLMKCRWHIYLLQVRETFSLYQKCPKLRRAEKKMFYLIIQFNWFTKVTQNGKFGNSLKDVHWNFILVVVLICPFSNVDAVLCITVSSLLFCSNRDKLNYEYCKRHALNQCIKCVCKSKVVNCVCRKILRPPPTQL